MRILFLAYKQPPPPCVLQSRGREWGFFLPLKSYAATVLLDWGPTLMTSFNVNYLLETPFPSIVTLEIRASYEFQWERGSGVGHDSVHSRGPGDWWEFWLYLLVCIFHAIYTVEVGLRTTPGSLPYRGRLFLISSWISWYSVACPLFEVVAHFLQIVDSFGLLFLFYFVGYYGKLELQFTAGIKITSK